MLGAIAAIIPSAHAQRSDNPNLRNFYMSRQQWTITDDAPIINDQRTQPGASQGGQGALPAGPAPLPKAGWQPYSSNIPSVRTALPEVNTGVPKNLPTAPSPRGVKANAGTLKPKGPAAQSKPATPTTVQSYSTYRGYGSNLSPATGSGTGQGSMQSSTSVQGSVLHWARSKRKAY